MISNANFLESFREDLARATSLKSIERALRKLTACAEVSHALYVLPVVPGHPPPAAPADAPSTALTITTYPALWLSRYIDCKYYLIDPVTSIQLYGNLPIDWSDLPKESRKVRDLYGEAAEFGIGPHGLNVPIRGRFNEFALLTITSDEPRSSWDSKLRSIEPHLNLAANLLHTHVLRLTMKDKQSSTPSLSRRERECIVCLAAGLRDAEIAERLGISRRVASAYIESLRYKVDAPTRANAVARAFKTGILTLGDI